MEPVTASLMAIGSGSAAGLRPYFTVFALGLAGLAIPENAPGVISGAVNQIPDSVANPWVLAICAILALGDSGLDKVPLLNISMESLSSWLRPIFGSLVGLQLGVESGPMVTVLTTVLGTSTSLPVSLGKLSSTAATNVVPDPVTQWIRSLFEDFGALILVVAAILLPILAAFLGIIAVAIGITLFIMFRKTYKAMKTKFSEVKQKQAEARALKQAQIASGERSTTLQVLKNLAAGATPAMATGVTTSAGVMRVGAENTASWAKSATANATQFSSSSFRRVSGATSSAINTARSRMQTPPAQAPLPTGMIPPPPDTAPQTPPQPPMPPQEAAERPNYPTATPAPAAPPKPPQTPMWSRDGQYPGPTPLPSQPPTYRAQAAGERAGQAVANVKGQVGKLRGQFDGFKKGLKQSGEDTPSGDQTPPPEN